MLATAFNEENVVFNPPDGMSPEECSVLSCFMGKDENGQHVIISCWKPTAEEWEEMKKTGRIWIIILGTSLPPIAPSGISPFKM